MILLSIFYNILMLKKMQEWTRYQMRDKYMHDCFQSSQCSHAKLALDFPSSVQNYLIFDPCCFGWLSLQNLMQGDETNWFVNLFFFFWVQPGTNQISPPYQILAGEFKHHHLCQISAQTLFWILIRNPSGMLLILRFDTGELCDYLKRRK